MCDWRAGWGSTGSLRSAAPLASNGEEESEMACSPLLSPATAGSTLLHGRVLTDAHLTCWVCGWCVCLCVGDVWKDYIG